MWGETRTAKLLRPLPAMETLAHVWPIPVAMSGMLVAIAVLVTTPTVAVAISRMIKVLPVTAPRPAGGSVLIGSAKLPTLR